MLSFGDRLLSIGLVALCAVIGSGGVFAGPSERADESTWTLGAWRDRTLQRALEGRTSVRVSQGVPLVTAYNQFLWSILGTAPPESSLTVGRNGELYGRFSVQEYCDVWPAHDTRDSDLRQFAANTKILADRMHASGRAFVVVATPSKSATVPAHLPRSQCAGEATDRVPPRLVAALRDASVPLVDGISLVRRAVRDSTFPIFPRYGIHWNQWGAYPTVAEMLGLVAEQLGEPRPTLTASTVTLVDASPESVRERNELIGLRWGPPAEQVPTVRFTLDARRQKRRATIVGDSFSEAMINVLTGAEVFARIERFNYLTEFHRSYPGGFRAGKYEVDDIDWARDVFGSDVVILEINEMLGLHEFARTFVKEALQRMPPAAPRSASFP